MLVYQQLSNNLFYMKKKVDSGAGLMKLLMKQARREGLNDTTLDEIAFEHASQWVEDIATEYPLNEVKRGILEYEYVKGYASSFYKA